MVGKKSGRALLREEGTRKIPKRICISVSGPVSLRAHRHVAVSQMESCMLRDLIS